MREVVVVDGLRTPTGNFGGALKDMSALELGRIVVEALFEKTGLDKSHINEVIFGCAGQSSDAPNIARVISLKAGLDQKIPAYTVHRNCASGIQAIVNGAQSIMLGDSDVVLVGGTESMSQAPYLSRDMRFGKRMRHSQMIDSLWEGLTDPVCNILMGETAENLVTEFNITREEQDKYATDSHKKAFRATREGKFKDEMMQVMIPKKAAGKAVAPEPFTQDEGINPAINPQALAMYPAIFKKVDGSVTPGNACPMSDGASCMVLMSKDKADALGLSYLAKVKAYSFVGLEPERMGYGPALAIPAVLEKAGWKQDEVDLFEVNEAFAAQVIAVNRTLNLPADKFNVNGGAIALGHALGSTGTRISLTLLKEMVRRDAKKGIAALCIGGGLGAAIAFERV
jgi:acetyl-CoA C-acetyltransferase